MIYMLIEIRLNLNLLLAPVVVNQLVEPNVEILLRRSQQIRRLEFFDDYVYLHDSDFDIGYANDPNSFKQCFVQKVIIG